MAADDLETPTKMLHWLIYSTMSQAKIIARYNGPEFRCTVKQDITAWGQDGTSNQPTLMIRFLGKNGEDVDCTTQEALFQPLSKLACGRMDFKIHNFNHSLFSSFSGQLPTMSPGSIYCKAVAWHMVETVRGFKKTADDLATAGDFIRAIVWYNHIWKLFTTSSLLAYVGRGMIDVKETHTATLEPIVILNSLVLKAAVAEGTLRIKNGIVDKESDYFRIKVIDGVHNFNSRLTHPTCCSIEDAMMLAGYHCAMILFIVNRDDIMVENAQKSMERVSLSIP